MAASTGAVVSIDEALNKTGFGRFNYCLIVISGFILINVVLECCGICFVLPVIDCDINLSYQQKGLLGAVGFLGIITSSHLWGYLADTTGRRNVIRPTLLAAYMVTAMSSLSPNFETLVILRYLNGFLISGGSATIFAYLGEFHSNQLRNRALMGAAFISAFTAIFHPIVAWATINQTWSFDIPLLNITYRSWRLNILVIGFLGFFGAMCLFCFPESPKYLLSIGKEEECKQILKKIYCINTGNNGDTFKLDTIVLDPDEKERMRTKIADKKEGIVGLGYSIWNQTAPLFMRDHWRKTILACLIQFWIYFIAHGLYMWFPHVLNRVMQFTSVNPDVNLDLCEILYIMDNNVTAFLESSTVCTPTLELDTYKHTLALEFVYVGLFFGVGYLTGKVGRIPTLLIILLVCGICGVLCVVITIPLVAVYLLVVLLVCGLATTVLNVITVDLYPTHLRAMAVCISLMFGRIGSVAGTSGFGILLEHNCKFVLSSSSVALILSGFIAFLIPTGKGTVNVIKSVSA